jgi:ATP-dependent 26S proteasome regulatory subunit
MSLQDLLHFRYPLLWVQTDESERIIFNLTQLMNDRKLYVFDALDGLTTWDEEYGDFKIILVEKIDLEGNVHDVPIQDFGEAFFWVYDQGHHATLVFRNFHQSAEKYYDVFASLYNKFYRSFRTDDAETLPVSVICLTTEAEVPAELKSIMSHSNIGPLDKSMIMDLLAYLESSIPAEEAIIEDGKGEDLAHACRGMTELEIIDTVFSLVRRDGKLKSEEIERLKYERLKAQASIEIIQPRHGLEEVGGLDRAKEIIYNADWIRRNPEEAKVRRLEPINKILFLGVPGTGKSYICEGACKTLGIDLAKIGVSKAMNKFIGQSEANIRSMFAQVRALAPIGIWIDELGRDFQGGDHDGGTTNRVHGEMLTALQELPDNVALFAAANDISSLPPEMLRAERFDEILFVGYPAYVERILIFKLHLEGEDDHDWDKLARHSLYYTGAEIVQLIKKTRIEHMRQSGPITTSQLIETMPMIKNRLWVQRRGLIQHMYRDAYDKYEWASTEQRDEAGIIINPPATSSTHVVEKTQIKI